MLCHLDNFTIIFIKKGEVFVKDGKFLGDDAVDIGLSDCSAVFYPGFDMIGGFLGEDFGGARRDVGATGVFRDVFDERRTRKNIRSIDFSLTVCYSEVIAD